MSKNQIKKDDTLENVEVALGKTEQFIENNQKLLTIIVLALVVVVGGYYAYQKLYLQPLDKEAQKEVFSAQLFFERDEYKMALEGDGLHPGFLDIIDQFGQTNVGKLSRYYAGVSYLHLGEFENAIEYLKKFKTDSPELAAVSAGAIGDCYLELGNKEESLDWYEKAVSYENLLTAPFYLLKQGMLLEQTGKNEEALKAYQTIKDKYKTSNEARQIDKYITRLALK
jgi:tetratricopeptide (TPR) repeat protein